MVSYNKTSQKNLTVGGDVAGGSINKTTLNIHQYQGNAIYREDKKLRILVEECERVIHSNPERQELTKELSDYLARKFKGSPRDLSQKLRDGGRERFIDHAIGLKEYVAKKIFQNGTFASAQKIYTYLLSEMYIIFTHQVESKIISGNFTVDNIDDIVRHEIINPLLDNIETCSLEIDSRALYGLLYILTGNCYIKWDCK